MLAVAVDAQHGLVYLPLWLSQGIKNEIVEVSVAQIMLVMLSALELLYSNSGVLEQMFVQKVICCVYWGRVFMLLELKP
jgi:hypothetical protein